MHNWHIIVTSDDHMMLYMIRLHYSCCFWWCNYCTIACHTKYLMLLGLIFKYYYKLICLSYCMFLFFNLFMDLSLSYIWFPYIMWWWLTACDLFPYMISESFQDLLLSVISHDLLISASSYAFILLPLSPTPYPYNQGCMHFHCDAAHR